MTSLPTSISGGTPGHRSHHNTVHALLNSVDAPFEKASNEADVFSNLPAAGQPNRLYWATDTNTLYMDDGVTWDIVGSFDFLRGATGDRPAPAVTAAVTIPTPGAALTAADNIFTGTNTFNGTSAFDGKAKFKNGPWIDVTHPDYGAVGNGIVDDTAAVQVAITAGAGGTVFFPLGTYKVTSPLTIPTNTRVFGCGVGSVINDATGNNIILSLFDVENVWIDGLKLTGTGSLGTAGRAAIWAGIGTSFGARKCKVSNVWIDVVGTCGVVWGNSTECHMMNVYIRRPKEHGVYVSSSSKITGSDVHVIEAGYGGASTVVGYKFVSATDCHFVSGVVDTPLTEGVIFDTSTRCSVDSHSITNCPQRGIRYLAGSVACGATGTSVTNSGSYAIRDFGGACNYFKGTLDGPNGAVLLDAAVTFFDLDAVVVSAAAGAYAIDVSGDSCRINGIVSDAVTLGVRINASAGSTRIGNMVNKATGTKWADSGTDTKFVTQTATPPA